MEILPCEVILTAQWHMCQKKGLLSYTAAKTSEVANVDINTEYELGDRGLLRGKILEKVRKDQVGI
jgi:hypothetical protein